jgi:hypothetical protein
MSDEYRLIGVKWNEHDKLDTILNNTRILANKRYILFLIIVEFILALNCIIGDYLIFDTNKLIETLNVNIGLSQRLIRALLDNSSHSFIGVCSWFLITYPNLDLQELICSGLIASLIDLDHFISAKSFSLLDVISLSNRPFLHNSFTLIILNTILYILMRVFSVADTQKYSMLILISWFSHHVRDANRRGLWFGSLYTTKPLNDGVYLSIILILPIIIRVFILNPNLKAAQIFDSILNTTNSAIFQVNIRKEDVHIV